MRYRIGDEVALGDHFSGEIVAPARAVGLRFAERESRLLACFRQAVTIEDVVSGLRLDPQTTGEIATLFHHWIEAGILVPVCDATIGAGTGEVDHGAALPQLTSPGVTMFDCPFRRLDAVETGEIVFLGVPFDLGTTGFPGARFGPEAIRGASVERFEYRLDPVTRRLRGWFHPAAGRVILKDRRMADIGNLAFTVGEARSAIYARLRAVVDRLHAMGCFPVVLGGDHSITYATVPATPAALIHIDAHSDLAEWDERHCHHHGNVLTRLCREGRLSALHHFGLRVVGAQDCVLHDSVAHAIDGDWCEALAGIMAHVSLDIDVLDPSVAPGTGTPTTGGPDLDRLGKLLETLARTVQSTGLDLVEVCPIRDAAGLTERVAVELLLRFIGALPDHPVSG